jgi:ribosomal protein L21E
MMKRQGQLPLAMGQRRKVETMTIKVGDRVRVIANTPHKVGMETISLRGYTGVVKALERYGDRAMVSVEKVATRSGGSWRQTKLHIRIAAADLEILSDNEGAS